MSSLSRELVFLILQFLDEEKFKETVHKLEQESGFFFNMKHFEDQVQAGEWDEVERYLCGFTKVEDNRYSMKIFFEIRKQKYLEALDRQDRAKAVEILVKDLKVFASFNEELFKEITQLLTLDNFRQNEQLSKYGDTKSARNIMLVELKKLIEANPLFRDKLTFPVFKSSRLRTLINQRLFLCNILIYCCWNLLADTNYFSLLCIVTCGDDKMIKVSTLDLIMFHVSKLSFSLPFFRVKQVWDAVAGRKQYTFEGHEAPVYSVCPHYKENIQFIFSTAIDGKIKAWLYDCLGSRVDYDAPGHWCTMMAYSAEGTRLFSCGTSKEGESHLVEWNESEGAVKRTYSGFRNRSLGVVQFDTTRNRFLAAGDEFQIKFWDMDNVSILTAVDADGGLPASPRLRFNKEGSLLAVTTNDNGIKILANNDGLRLIRMLEGRAIDKTRGPSEPMNSKPLIVNALGPVANVSASMTSTLERSDRTQPAVSISGLSTMDSSRLVDVKPRISDDVDKIKSWKIPDIVDLSQLKALRLPDSITASKVVRLIYTNSGLALLALASNAVHKLWKWQRSERNPSVKATAYVAPQLWQPPSGTLMTNDINDNKPAEESAACIALSKNDSYVMSASGGKVSLFNMMTFKVMTTFMSPPPAATFLAFHPQDNNIIAIGMEDSTIQIYNVRVDEVKTKLKGHQNRITGLAFSQTLNVLVSSGADAQLCVWSIDGWEKKKSRFIQPPAGRQSPLVGESKVQFHNDQAHLLVVHESQIAIYDSKLECLRSWSPKETLAAPISTAIYSCDGLLVYTGFCDGAVGVFDADSLRLRCRIAPSAYIPSFAVSGNTAYPMVIAAHPSEPNQIALGMSDGTVHVVEPSDIDLKWGGSSSQDNGPLPSNSSNPSLSAQPSELPSR
ncbi:LOW QUALITY PROTEIN: WD40 domain-containing protein [Cephalotus follicularis]|uniref:WD40 domain-containing protein n=1 Tax=Cephalotus follicularis TaxID=3775 RepID=A0A1Q3CCK9_CEPFO|nr:LOW QUALITY PROTEIN: WD40 domain-containing protein [Cephalotus follicularis]